MISNEKEYVTCKILNYVYCVLLNHNSSAADHYNHPWTGGISTFYANISIKLHLWIDNHAAVRYYDDMMYNKYKVHNEAPLPESVQ